MWGCGAEVTPCGAEAGSRKRMKRMDPERQRFPHSVVWTPIPLLSWIFPIIGHMGICTLSGIIRDFAGPYYVSEDNMAFGNPTKFWQLDPAKVSRAGPNPWDTSVLEASEEYKQRMHNLCCDNCHSHVAMSLNLMQYDNRTSWNMVNLCLMMLVHGQYVSFSAFLRTWLPFLVILTVLVIIAMVMYLR